MIRSVATLAPTIHLDDYELTSDMSPIQVSPDPVTMHLEDEVITEVVFANANMMTVAVDKPVAAMSKTHLVSSEQWSWQQLRDYVVAGITERMGAFPRNPVTEAAIFKSFLDRWGDRAEQIARQAIEVHQCWWRSTPLSIQRFCVASDPYFAEVLAASL